VTGARPARPHLLIVEEALKNHHGHYFTYARRVAEFNQAEGVAVEVAAHADVERDLEWSLPVHPLFATSYWDGSYPIHSTPKRQRRELLRANRRAYRELAAHFARSERYDLVFVPSLIAHQVLAWLAILWRFGGRKIGSAVLLFRMGASEPHGLPGEPIEEWNARFLARCLRLFRPLVWLGRVRFATDSDALARHYHALCGIPFTVLPSPQHSAPSAIAPPARADGPLRFVSLGPAQFIKGSDVLLDAIRLLRADPPRAALRFAIHWPIPRAVAHGREPLVPDEALAESGWVEYVRRTLSADEYDALLRSSDCVLLPYRVDPYALRTSGVQVEAATAGVPMIVTAGTTQEAELRAYGAGLVARDGSPSDLADRIREFAVDAEKYRALARERIALAREYHSPERFQNLLWGRSND
jgi:glycosyltransferase involved in cell wall biosynthesis